MHKTISWAAAAAALVGTAALAHENSLHARTSVYDPAKVEKTAFGQEGDRQNMTRTVRVSMRDSMRFEPAVLEIARGETVRLVVQNQGEVLHEFVLGTANDIARHAELMRRFPGMEHEEPYMAHVKPQASGEIVWQFTEAGEFKFACLLPGHLEAGMTGKVKVK